jgi:quinol monooxygenase YgiN
LIIVTGNYRVAPEQRDRFMGSKQDQVARTRTESGCIEYAYSADAEEPGLVRLIEHWESMDDLEAHLRGFRSDPPPQGDIEVVDTTFAVFEATPAAFPRG